MPNETEQKKQKFSLLFALKNNQKAVLENKVAEFLGKSEYGNVRNTCTEMHGPITKDIDRRKRFKYSKKIFHNIMKPLCRELDSYCCGNDSDIIDVFYSGCIFIIAGPAFVAATLASSCTFFKYCALDAKNSSTNDARDSQIKNLLPGLSMDIFDKSKPEGPPNHQQMEDDDPSSPRLR